MKIQEELNVLKEEVDTLNKKLSELTEDELNQVAGGGVRPYGVTLDMFAINDCLGAI